MKIDQHIEDTNWELLAKSHYYEIPEITTEEDSAVNKEFQSKSDKQQLLKIVKQVDLFFDLMKYPAEEAWIKVESRIHSQVSFGKSVTRKLISSPRYRMFAAILVTAVLLVSGYVVFFNQSASVKILEISAVDQVLNTFTLPDGTLVSLNSNAKLFYPEQFGNESHEVTIEGEAFFEVKPDKSKPFIIHAGKARIEVLGTSFYVSAYHETKLVEVIIQTGKVEIQNQTSETLKPDELILTPGDRGTLAYASNTMLKTTNQDPDFLAWKTHIFIFNSTSLREVIENLEKVCKVNIRVADPKLNKRLLTAQFNNYSLDFVLKLIENTLIIDVKEVDGQYILNARS